ncbi:DNA polymerase III subunit delta' [Halioglobus japonicus]|nr:DNA polymerase III subunit delta' [Halioglobus japonicus]
MIDVQKLPAISTPLPWHDGVWTQLNQQLVEDQLPHALMLVGRQYTGKSQLAMALARLLLCAQPQGALNCGKCHACELSASGGHGDFLWVTPLEKSRVIKIDQVRDVVRFTSKTAGFGARKVIVLAPAETMNVNAFNALLKSLEEPASGTYLILVCDHMYGVPATIRSRCHIKHLPTPATAASLDWLDLTTGQRERSQELLSLADGLPLLARDLYCGDAVDELVARRLALEGVIAGRITVQKARSLWGDADLSVFLEHLTGEMQRLLGSLSLERLRSKPGQQLFKLLDEVSQLRRAVNAGANPSKDLLVEALFAKAQRRLGADLLGDSIHAQTGDTGT